VRLIFWRKRFTRSIHFSAAESQTSAVTADPGSVCPWLRLRLKYCHRKRRLTKDGSKGTVTGGTGTTVSDSKPMMYCVVKSYSNRRISRQFRNWTPRLRLSKFRQFDNAALPFAHGSEAACGRHKRPMSQPGPHHLGFQPLRYHVALLAVAACNGLPRHIWSIAS
jgi:hypothetical protein